MAKGAWREVVHIEDSTGPHGGEHWILTLACGHVKSKPRPPFRIWRVFDSRGMTAPKRVRCLICKEEEEQENGAVGGASGRP